MRSTSDHRGRRRVPRRVVGGYTRDATWHASTGPIPLNCDRACLEGVINQYLAAVVAHDPKRLPLSEDVMYTENDQVLKVGDGFWKTAAGIGNYKHIFADPEFGQVAFMGTMQEAGSPLLLSLRLRIELGRITEIESVYFRTGGGGPNNIAGMDQAGKIEDMWFKSIPPAQRAVPPADDLHRRRLLHRSAEERRQGHPGHRHVSVHHRLPSHRKRIAHHERAEAGQRAPGHHQRLCHGLSVAVQDGLLLRRAGHPRSPLPAGRQRARRRLVARRVRSRDRERGRAVGRHGSTRSEASIGRPASWSPRRFSSRTARSAASK